MTMKTTYRLLAGCAAALLVASAAHAADWTEDYAAAAKQAKAQHKMILLNFTGSDWCIWCKKTDAEVFATKEFKEFADKKLVLVKLDYPREHPQADAIKAQNEKLLEKFGVTGFPMLVILDSHEKVVFAQEGYKEGGPAAFFAEFPKTAN
jgi:thioredoxin-related protein